MNINAIHKRMEADGFVLMDQGYSPVSLNSTPYWRYIHKETFELIIISEESIEDEEFVNTVFGIEEADVEEALRKRTGKNDIHSIIFDWDNEDFKAVIRELIEKGKERLRRKENG